MYRLLVALFLLSFTPTNKKDHPDAWIRINQLGYTPAGVKVAVWGSKEMLAVDGWQLIDAKTKKIASSGKTGSS